jgi:hypothetical protein
MMNTIRTRTITPPTPHTMPTTTGAMFDVGLVVDDVDDDDQLIFVVVAAVFGAGPIQNVSKINTDIWTTARLS